MELGYRPRRVAGQAQTSGPRLTSSRQQGSKAAGSKAAGAPLSSSHRPERKKLSGSCSRHEAFFAGARTTAVLGLGWGAAAVKRKWFDDAVQ